MRRTAAKETPKRPVQWEDVRVEPTDEILADITRRIVERFNPYKVILFGSYAYGKPHLYSDIDLLVVMDSEQRWPERYRNVAAIAKVPFLPMDLIALTPAELEKRLEMGDHFYHEILAKGRVLYDRDAA